MAWTRALGGLHKPCSAWAAPHSHSVLPLRNLAEVVGLIQGCEVLGSSPIHSLPAQDVTDLDCKDTRGGEIGLTLFS